MKLSINLIFTVLIVFGLNSAYAAQEKDSKANTEQTKEQKLLAKQIQIIKNVTENKDKEIQKNI